ncbi:MAG: sigma 54-interacting transcriptional regulator [Candidatus Eisenbacteria bacterium]|uniref:Sigma 54-interacting transcriptional regulator n=1 Tax=Eiseniibacteriota bacterium TaxID=2212470 RepID=A0A849SM81_UNCEI|nr:sigma 54-interacting transcriptional regulator [Candidatus Eisenbacteria bacterium]
MPFDRVAQDRIAARFRTCPPQVFLAELEAYTPASREQRVLFEIYRGWVLYDAGEYPRSRPHLLRALRRSRPSSHERSISRALLGESYLRFGQYHRAERCTHRALSDNPSADPEHFLQAGHRLMLGRIYRMQGHLSHALETFQRALELVDESSPHWTPLMTGLALGQLHAGDLRSANATVQTCRRVPASVLGVHQGWAVAVAESSVALELGEPDRAERVMNEAVDSLGSNSGERIRLVLDEALAAVCRARGDWPRAEALLRGVLERSVLGGRNSDMVSTSARSLAETFFLQGKLREALEAARLAARAGSAEDRLEWAAGLRLMGASLAALGARDEARRTFREAISVHERTQFALERRQLETAMQRAEIDVPVPHVSPAAAVTRRAPESRVEHRIALASGRTFITCDTRLVESVRLASLTDLPVLIEGETGTGKELVANLLHELGPRAKSPLVVVDCTSLPENLADVELFGAARGAYTGAFHERLGLLAQADGGTLLLDELPELSTALQAKLLRVVQEGSYRRVGEDRPRHVRIRFVATTNRAIQELLETGVLKPDLFYRLSGHRISLRPLRFRRDEIGPLALEITKRCGLGGATRSAVEWLEGHAWPGNVRQLEMLLRLAAGSCALGGMLEVEHLEPHVAAVGSAGASHGDGIEHDSNDRSLRGIRLTAERGTLERALESNDGVVTRAARALGLSRQAFYKAMKRTGLAPASSEALH